MGRRVRALGRGRHWGSRPRRDVSAAALIGEYDAGDHRGMARGFLSSLLAYGTVTCLGLGVWGLLEVFTR